MKDFLIDEDLLMKFNVVVGNPPYQDGTINDEAHKLWGKFAKLAFEMTKPNGFIAMITPSTWLNPADDVPGTNIFTDLFKKNDLILANVANAVLQREFFPNVGSRFTWWIVRKGDYSGSTHFITEDGEIDIDISDVDYLPKRISKESVSIIKKFNLKKDTFDWLRQGDLSGETVKEKDENHPYPCYHTPAKGGRYWWGKTKNPYADTPKILVSLSGKYVPHFDNQSGFTKMCIIALFETEEEGLNAVTILNSKLYRWIVEQSKHSGFNTLKPILALPKLDIHRPWTDMEIYAAFNLTQEEIDYIESKIK